VQRKLKQTLNFLSLEIGWGTHRWSRVESG